jgi:xanthine/uracil permease
MLHPRNAAIISLGLAPAVGLRTIPPELLGRLPDTIRPLLSDAMVAGLIVVLLAYFLLPGRRDSDTPVDAA